MGAKNFNFGRTILPQIGIYRPKFCIFGWVF